jgi:hypothetical protein
MDSSLVQILLVLSPSSQFRSYLITFDHPIPFPTTSRQQHFLLFQRLSQLVGLAHYDVS